MKKDFSLIQGLKNEMALKYNFGRVCLNHLILKEGEKTNSIFINGIKEICSDDEYSIIHFDCWGADEITVDFSYGLSAERIKDIEFEIGMLYHRIIGLKEANPETRLSYRVEYNDNIINSYCEQLLKAYEEKKITWRNANCRIRYYGKYNNECVSAIIQKPRQRTKGYVLYNIDIVMLGIENGFIGSVA